MPAVRPSLASALPAPNKGTSTGWWRRNDVPLSWNGSLSLWTTTSRGRGQGRSVLVTGTTGGRRAWTVSMISALQEREPAALHFRPGDKGDMAGVETPLVRPQAR